MRTLGICIGASSITIVGLEKNSKNIEKIELKKLFHNSDSKGTLIRLLEQVDLNLYDKFCITGRKIRKIINKNNIVRGKFINSNSDQSRRFSPKNREQLLAWDISVALNDFSNFTTYLSYANKYPEPLLRKILGEVKEAPHEKLKSSRRALFNHFIQKYDK